MSIRARLTLWHAGVLSLLILCFAAATYLILRAKVYGKVEERLSQERSLVEKAIPQGEYEVAELDEHGAVTLFQVDGFRSHGWASAGLDRALPGDGARWTWKAEDGREYRLARGNGCVVAQDTTHAKETIRALLWVLALALPLALVAALAGGYLLTGRLLGPVGAMAERASRITAESLDERLPVADPNDELGTLAIAFNETLARLHDAFERLRRFTADASHELRTPLTAIRSVGEVALQGTLEPAAYRDVIGSMLEEVDRLSRLVESLLLLTRAEASPRRERVDLGAVTASVVDCLRVLAEEREQTLTLDAAPSFAEADPAILRQAIANILDNAIKYTPRGGEIRVRARDGVIEIRDSGPGIPESHREKIFERFHRIDGARSRDAGGVGLGLAIARWAVEANRGRIELDTAEGRGSAFRIVLPRS